MNLKIFVFKNLKKYYFYRVFCFYFRECWGDISDIYECEQRWIEECKYELYEKTPAAMNTMLEKQPRAEALLKRQQRSKMVVTDVPPTKPGTLHHITAVHSTNYYNCFIDNLWQNLLIWTIFFYCHLFTNASTTTGICNVKSQFFLPHQSLRSQKPLDSSLRGERKEPENAGSASSLWRATKMLWIVHAIGDKNS